MNHIHVSLIPPVARIELNAPPVNVIDRNLMNELQKRLDDIENREDIRYILVESAIPGRFSAGVSVPEHHPDQAPEMIRQFHQLMKHWLLLRPYTIAKVSGFAYGGAAEWLLMFDRVYAVPDAAIGFPEIKLAFFPPIALAVLPEIIGYQRASRLILSGETPKAETWVRLGWDIEICPLETMDASIRTWVETLENHSHPVTQLTRQTLQRLYATRWIQRIDEAEDVFIRELLTLADPEEGVQAFIEKRKPEWQHR